MRSTLHGPEEYLLKSKKPHVIELVSKALNMSNDEINSLNEKPDVIKGLLRIKSLKELKNAERRAEAIADAMIAAHNNLQSK